PEHGQGALGLEYTIQHGQSSVESTLIMEGQAVLGIGSRDEAAALSFFQGDMLLGWRLAFNDILNRSLLLSAIFDVQGRDEKIFQISYDQRLNDTWGLKLSGRAILAPPSAALPFGLEAQDQDHNASLTLTRYF